MLIDEVEQVQNPGLGATLIWRFACGYESDETREPAPLTYAFLVVPLLFNKKVLNVVASTKKGLRKVEEKLNTEQSLLATSQERVVAMRGLSRESFALALRTGLISVDTAHASFRARSIALPMLQDEGITTLLRAAEKLGTWASQVSLREFCFVFHLEL